METYKPLKGYEKYYLISDHGNIKSLRTNKILKQWLRNNGYNSVEIYKTLKDQDTSKRVDIQILVANTFLIKPKSDKKLIVDHINGIKTDNRVENLRWVTYSENMKNAYKNDNNNLKKLRRGV